MEKTDISSDRKKNRIKLFFFFESIENHQLGNLHVDR